MKTKKEFLDSKIKEYLSGDPIMIDPFTEGAYFGYCAAEEWLGDLIDALKLFDKLIKEDKIFDPEVLTCEELIAWNKAEKVLSRIG